MKDINIPAQIVMVVAFVVLASSFWCKKRENILRLQVVSSILFVVQYIMLGVPTAVVLNIISTIRAHIFRKKKEGNVTNSEDKKSSINWSSKWVLYTLIIIYVIASVITSTITCLRSDDITRDLAISIFALIATILNTIGLWADDPQFIRLIADSSSIFWILTNFLSGGYAGCVTECILIVSNTTAFFKHRKKKDSSRKG